MGTTGRKFKSSGKRYTHDELLFYIHLLINLNTPVYTAIKIAQKHDFPSRSASALKQMIATFTGTQNPAPERIRSLAKQLKISPKGIPFLPAGSPVLDTAQIFFERNYPPPGVKKQPQQINLLEKQEQRKNKPIPEKSPDPSQKPAALNDKLREIAFDLMMGDGSFEIDSTGRIVFTPQPGGKS